MWRIAAKISASSRASRHQLAEALKGLRSAFLEGVLGTKVTRGATSDCALRLQNQRRGS
jgi:hypothetical protein